jgi:hypothetical protein
MIWFLIVLAGVAAVYLATRRSSPADGSASLEPGGYRKQIAAGISITAELVRPDPLEWAREREERKRARESAVARLRSAFARPESLAEAVAGVRHAIVRLAQAWSQPAPDVDEISRSVRQTGTKEKMELAIRKRLSDSYRLRDAPEKLLEALACCLVSIQLLVEYKDTSWKLTNAFKRIANYLDHEHYRQAIIGFLLVVGDALRQDCTDFAVLSDDLTARLFLHWHADEEAWERFQTDLAQVRRSTSASDKHFLLNELVDYLDRRRRFDPSVRAQLVELCEEDMALYKTFLADFNRDGEGRASFTRVMQSQHYMCPALPSFDIMWSLFEEERNVRQLRRLQKIAQGIKYGNFEIDEDIKDDQTAARRPAERASVAGATPASGAFAAAVATEIIEVRRSGRTGKLAFVNAAGEPCSTEDAAEEHFRQLGFKTLRAEYASGRRCSGWCSGKRSSPAAARRTPSTTSLSTSSPAPHFTRLGGPRSMRRPRRSLGPM